VTETVHIAQSNSPIGLLRIASTQKGLAYVELPHPSGMGLSSWLEHNVPDAKCVDDMGPNRAPIEQILEFLDGQRNDFEIQLDLRGTPFQHAVWAALLEIPYGEHRSYKDIACAVDRPTALRAVGSANNANPVSLVVPCHRVIASDGSLGGYGGGLELKARLLAMEGSGPSRDRLL
jgi:O-6-methylguanine DNA methyltransferase